MIQFRGNIFEARSKHKSVFCMNYQLFSYVRKKLFKYAQGSIIHVALLNEQDMYFSQKGSDVIEIAKSR